MGRQSASSSAAGTTTSKASARRPRSALAKAGTGRVLPSGVRGLIANLSPECSQVTPPTPTAGTGTPARAARIVGVG